MSSEIIKSLEITFGKIPKLIEENMKYFSYNSDSGVYTCIPCNKKIKMSYNNNCLSNSVDFEGHILSKEHEENTVPMNILMNYLMETFSGNIPQIVLNHILVMTMDDVFYICAICGKLIEESTSSSKTELNFSYHLLSVAHTTNMQEFNAVLSQLQNIYGGIPPVVLNNSDFLTPFKDDKKYLCSLCDEILLVNPNNLNRTIKSFENHLYSGEHIKNVKVNKIISLIPEMENCVYYPGYLITSIDYFSRNGTNCFCVLCNENIKPDPNNSYQTEQVFKAHILSEFHQQNLKFRRDPSNAVFVKLSEVFQTLPDIVVENLDYLIMYKDKLSCSVCEEFLIEEENSKNILNIITSHLKSKHHTINVNDDMWRQQNTLDSLKSLFGSVPKLIQDNIDNIEFIGKTNNLKCLLCHKVVESSGSNEEILSSLYKNFQKHLNCNQHLEQEQNLNHLSESIRTDLEEIFISIPHFVVINWDYIDYDKSGEHFNCVLCDTKILVVKGTKMDVLTSQNLRIHFLSTEHLSALKSKANEKQETAEKLDEMFGKVPSYVMSNIHYLYEEKGKFYCKICDEKIFIHFTTDMVGDGFYKHLNGTHHKALVRKSDMCHELALECLDKKFSRIPEFLLRNIYHLRLCNNELLCLVCQKLLPIDEHDLESAKRFLRCHIDSVQHKGNVKFV